jgi:hypothetical protein
LDTAGAECGSDCTYRGYSGSDAGSLPAPVRSPGNEMTVPPGSGKAAKPVAVPIESRATWAVGPPPSTGASVKGKPLTVTVTRTPTADADPENADRLGDGASA